METYLKAFYWIVLYGQTVFWLRGLSTILMLRDKTRWIGITAKVKGKLKGVVRQRLRHERHSVNIRDRNGFILFIEYEVDNQVYEEKTTDLIAGYEVGDDIPLWFRESNPKHYRVKYAPTTKKEYQKKMWTNFTIGLACLTCAIVLHFVLDGI